jgi:EmrB/QacA subfamily drug resistance transporter
MSARPGAIAARPAADVHARRWWILAVLVASEFVVELDTTIVNIAIPDLARSLDAGTRELQWIVDAYILVFGTLALFCGTLADRSGRRRALLLGLGLFGVGSLAAALATTSGQLIAMRAVMGLGAAFILPATLSILVNVFEPGEATKAFAIWSSVVGLSFALGPTLGGWLVEQSGWSAIFWINIPLLAGTVVGAVRLVPSSRAAEVPRADPLGAVLSIVGLGLLVYAVIEAPHSGWGDPLIVGLLAAATTALVALVAWESRHPAPLYDLHLFRKRDFSGAVLAVGLSYLALGGALFILTQYLQFVLEYSPLEAGIRLVPAAIVVALVTPLSVSISRRMGARTGVASGLALVAAGMFLLATVSDASGYALAFWALVLAGGGLGLAFTPTTDVVLRAVPPSRAGGGSALQTTALTLGGTLGVAILGSVLATSSGSSISSSLAGHGPATANAEILRLAQHAFVHGAARAFLVGAVVAAAGAALAGLLLPGRAATPDETP